MKRINHRVVIVSLAIFFLLVFSAQVFASGSDRRGTAAAQELLIPVGARQIGMSGASVSFVSGIDAIYWNPAGLDRMQAAAAGSFSHMRYIADMNVSYVAAAAKSGLGSFGLSFKTIDFGDIPITTTDQPDGTGALFSPQFITLGLTYSKGLTDRVAVGATMNVINETIDRVSASGYAFDIGVQYKGLLGLNGLSLGLAVKSIGPGLQFDGNGMLVRAEAEDTERPTSFYRVSAGTDELPSTMDIGLAYQFDMGANSNLKAAAVFSHNNYQDDLVRGALEYNFNNMIFLRGGYSTNVNGTEDPTGESIYIYGATFGAGFNYDLGGLVLTLDYAYRQAAFFDANNVFTLSLGF